MLKQEDYTHHISGQFNAELDALRNFMLEMGGKVEQQLANAIAALIAMDSGQAELIINRDHEVNQMEMSIDEQCATILARRQPAASDPVSGSTRSVSGVPRKRPKSSEGCSGKIRDAGAAWWIIFRPGAPVRRRE